MNKLVILSLFIIASLSIETSIAETQPYKPTNSPSNYLGAGYTGIVTSNNIDTNNKDLLKSNEEQADEIFFDYKKHFVGWYLGAGAGINNLNSKNFGEVSYSIEEVADNVILYRQQWHGGSTNPIGELFGGYGTVLNSRYYIGGKLFYRFLFNKINPLEINLTIKDASDIVGEKIEDRSAEIKSNYSYGAAIKLGYLLTPKAMIYVLAGVNQTHFKIKSEIKASSETITTAQSIQTKNTKTGWLVGTGFEVYLANQLSLLLQFDYSASQTINHTFTGVDDSIVYVITQKIKPHQSTCTLGLSYYFG